MSRQDKEFPSLGQQLDDNQSKQKKQQKQIGYDKNTSVQLQGMNDLVGFYYEGNSSQGQQSNQEQRGNRTRNNNRNNEQQDNRNNEQSDNRNNNNQNRQQQNYRQNQGSNQDNQQQQQSRQNQSNQYERKQDNFERKNQQNEYEVKQNQQNRNQSNQYEVKNNQNNSNRQDNQNMNTFIEKDQDQNQNQRDTQSRNNQRGNRQNNQQKGNNQQQNFQQQLQNDVNEYDEYDEEDNYQNNQRGNQQSQQNNRQKNQYEKKQQSNQLGQNKQGQEQYVAKTPQNQKNQMVFVEKDQDQPQQQNKNNQRQDFEYVQNQGQNQNQNVEYVQKNQQNNQNQNKTKDVYVAKNQNTQSYDNQNQYVPKNQQSNNQTQYTPKNQEYVLKDEQSQSSNTQYVQKNQKNQVVYEEASNSSNQNRQKKEQYVAKQNDQYVQKQTDQYVPKQTDQYVQKQDQYVPKNSQQNQNNDNNNQNYQKKQNRDQYVAKSDNNNQQQGQQSNQYVEKQNNQGNRQNTKQESRQDNRNKDNNQSDKQGDQNKEFKGKTARQKQQQNQEISNEWNSDVNKYLNQNQIFYLNEDNHYHYTQNKYNGQKRGIQKVLMVAEKPSIAKSIADALSNGTSRPGKGKSKYLPVHEFEGQFKGNRVLFVVTSVAGHVYGLDFPKECENWNRINPVNLFSSKTLKVEANPSSHVIKHLESEAQDCSYLLLWLDNDREGENICFEVKSICERVMCYEGNTQQVLRSKFSSLTKPDLVQAFKNIRDPPNMNESKAVDARQIIDLKIGAAFTRYQTLFFRNKYPELNESIISFGPCQTPTLGFCVQREDEIKNFKPRLYFRIKLVFLTEDKKEINSYYDKGHIYDQGEANRIHKEIVNQQHVSIVSVSSDNSSKQRPEGLNTVQLLKVASSYLHMSPMETMHVAERLYLSGYITYPRTESTAYPKTFQFDDVLRCLKEDSDYGKHAAALLKDGYNKPRQGVDMGDHPPITPTADYPDRIGGDERKLYDYISKHYIASLSEDCKYKKIAITSKVQGYTFVARGIQMIKKGFLEVQENISLGENTISSNLKEGDKLAIMSANLEQEYTTAPGFITESELIGLMEKNSIGTDASMATHIQNICNRNYVAINGSNRSLVPTELGRSLIHGYQKIDPELVQPQIRAKIENLVDQIAKGSKQFSDVINESMRIFQAKYLTFVENISKMDFLFGSFCTTFEDTLDAAKPFSKCGVCNRFMKIIEKAGKIICEKCDVTLSIPTNGKFKLAGEKKCPLDKYQVIFFTSLHTPNVSFEVCPKCYTESPIMDSDQVTCSICTNDECKQSMNSRFLKECYLCKVGDIVIEPQVAQKLAASCNECWTQWSLPIQTKDLKVNKEKKCDKCQSQVISFKHIVQQVKLPQKGETQDKDIKEKIQKIIKFSREEFIDTCLFCDPELQKECHQVEYHELRKRRNQRRKRR